MDFLIVTVTVVALGIYVMFCISYHLFNQWLPSRREYPPQSEFDLLRIDSGQKAVDTQEDGLDIIFVHGLGSQPDSTWRAQRPPPEKVKGFWSRFWLPHTHQPVQTLEIKYVFWVKDFLSSDLAKDHVGTRMFFYNYDSAYYRDASEKRLKDLGTQMMSRITSERQRSTEERRRQIVFVGHSYGGLVIKQALWQSRFEQDNKVYSLATNTKGIIFLGTPHNGCTMTKWGLRLATCLSFLGSNSAFLAGLIPGCDPLKDLQRDFISAFGQRLYIVNFFEELKTRLFKWYWIQKDEYIVSQDSATFTVPGVTNDSLRVDHSGLNKFVSRNSDYNNFLRRLTYIIDRPSRMSAPQVDHGQNFELAFDPVREVVNEFVGREGELQQIESHFQCEQGQGPRIVVLYGLGGIGKTQLASAYFNNVQLSYSARFRVSGKDRSSFIDDFVMIAEAAGLNPSLAKSSETIIKDVWKWLNLRRNDDWLIMLDNVDDPGNSPGAFDIDLFLKEAKQGSIIVTTRLPNLISNGRYMTIEVRAFDELNSLCILENNARRPLSREPDCGGLLDNLAGLPLALVQAGVYLSNTKCSIPKYLKMWNGAWAMLSKRLGTPSNYEERTMATTWKVSYDRIRNRNKAAADLLQFWAYLDHRNLDHEILQDRKTYFMPPQRLAALVSAEPVFLEAIGDLMENSFISSTGRDKWSLHHVLHKWICKILLPTLDKEYSRWSAICIGSNAEKRGATSYWDTSGRLCAHANHCMKSLQINQIGHSLQTREAWQDRLLGLSRLCIARGMNLDKAEEVLIFAVTGNSTSNFSSGGPNPTTDSETSLRAMNALGNMYLSRRSYVEAADTYRRLLLILQNLGSKRVNWLQDVCENFAMVVPLHLLEPPNLEVSDFLPVTKGFLEIMRRIKIANKTLAKGKLSEATVLFDALRAEIELNPNDKRSIKVWKDGALVYAQREDYGKASEIFEIVLSTAKKLKGGYKNSLTLDILNNYGHVCFKRGQFSRAEELLSAAVEGLQSRKGTNDGLYLNAAENLGDLLMSKGDYAKAKEVFEACLTEATGRFLQRASQIQGKIGSAEGKRTIHQSTAERPWCAMHMATGLAANDGSTQRTSQ